jgi:hypothetical protein
LPKGRSSGDRGAEKQAVLRQARDKREKAQSSGRRSWHSAATHRFRFPTRFCSAYVHT